MITHVKIGDTVSFKQENGVEITFRFGINSVEIRTGVFGTSLEIEKYGDFAAMCKGIDDNVSS